MADDPREDMPLADPPGDQLDVLRAEVEDQDGAIGGIGTFHERPDLFVARDLAGAVTKRDQNVSLPRPRPTENRAPRDLQRRIAGFAMALAH